MVDFEMKFLNLLEKVTNGSVIEISYTGTLRGELWIHQHIDRRADIMT